MVRSIFGTLILRYNDLRMITWIYTHNLGVVLGPYAQHCPCESLVQKWGPKPNPKLKEIELSVLQHWIRLEKTSHLKKESRNRMKNDQVMPI